MNTSTPDASPVVGAAELNPQSAIRNPHSPRIRILPPEVTSRIAAGEVIERPASVVKELIENSLDAGARHIRVDLSGGGMALIRVSDDGIGMSREDLELSVQPHATSKINDADEITVLSTLGFRGEALPSIAAVSKFVLTSRLKDAENAWRIELSGGLPRVPAARPAGASKGTSVEVRDLFFNLPARQKFIKGAGTESGACTEVALRLALSRPDVAFALYQDDQEIIELPAVCAPISAREKIAGYAAPPLDANAFMERARAVLGVHNAKGLFEIDSAHGSGSSEHFHGYRLFGLLSPPAISRPNRAHIFLNINGRPVKDRTLTSALLEAYRHLLPPRRYPLGVLFLELPPADVDINVHPTKAEVRFRSPGLVYALLHHAVRIACGTAPTAAQGGAAVEAKQDEHSEPPPIADCGLPIADSQRAGPEYRLAADLPRVKAPVQRHLDLWPRAQASQPPQTLRSYREEQESSASVAAEAIQPRAPVVSTSSLSQLPTRNPQSAIRNPQYGAPVRVIGQAQAAYIVIEDASGLKIVDQHALHERILFEALMQKAQSARGDSQGMIVPDEIELTPVQAAVFLQDQDAKETLADLGFDVGFKAPRTLLIRAIPAILTSARHKPRNALTDVLDAIAALTDDAAEKRPLSRVYYRERAAYVLSCKGAIKAGERLTVDQMSALIGDFQKIIGESGFTCPHGRPLALDVSWGEIERAVGR